MGGGVYESAEDDFRPSDSNRSSPKGARQGMRAQGAFVGQRRAADDRRVQRSRTSVDLEEHIRACTLSK